MKLEEFFADPVRTKEYQEWLKSPVTKRIVEILEELSRPLPLNMAAGQDASHMGLYFHGYNIGQTTFLNLLRGLDTTSAQLKEAQKALIPDYGSSKAGLY